MIMFILFLVGAALAVGPWVLPGDPIGIAGKITLTIVGSLVLIAVGAITT